MTILVVQCRMSSSRLPGKALLDLGGKTILDWNLSAMKKVKADEYYVATDCDSEHALKDVCERNGFKVFTGPLEDVLERFCLLIEKTGADTVIRATGDNPFLFYEAAQYSIDLYNKTIKNEKCDYLTLTGLPHGSGVEIINAKSLLLAKSITSDSYDHEHVGPALYNHKDKFVSMFVPAEKQWNYPEYRTTVDTQFDYRRAMAIVDEVTKGELAAIPFTAEQIVKAFENESIAHPVLCVPCVKKGKGTGHLRRCLAIALSIGGDVYIEDNAGLEEIEELIAEAKDEGLKDYQLTNRLPEKGDYSLIVTDAFVLDRDLALKLSQTAPVAAIDEGSLNTDLCDYLLDIIPSYGLARPANYADSSFITLPKNKRTEASLTKTEDIKNILVTVGGEDPADLVIPSVIAFSPFAESITGIVQNPEKAMERIPVELRQKITLITPVHNLREELYKYDVVVTHYGFTAFEAVAAGCGVVLLGTTALHVQLALKYGFVTMESTAITTDNVKSVLSNPKLLYPDTPYTKKGAGMKDLGSFFKNIALGRRFGCPLCADVSDPMSDPIISRTPLHTFRRCHCCGMLYMSWTIQSQNTDYNKSYFFEDYKKQYGKTYLDDFTAIKSQCIRRTSIIDYIYRSTHKAVTPNVLDIGCAFGPYLDAANDAGWQVFGTDISKEAVDYVQNTLHFPAVCAQFPDFNSEEQFGIRNFDAVTMWYVIEHFQNLDKVLKSVSSMLKVGGIFAFSTPSASGVSGRFNTQNFFQNSPNDHYTLWEPFRAASILKKYGFKVVKIVSTGHHPERFPKLARSKAKPTSLLFALYAAASHFFGLGDTFEVYCKKEKDL